MAENSKEKEKNYKKDSDVASLGAVGLAAGLAIGSAGTSLLSPPTITVEKEGEDQTIHKYVCPFDNIPFTNYQTYREHVEFAHRGEFFEGWVNLKEVEEPHYEEMIVDEIERFDQKNTAFARSQWDEDYREELLEISDLEEKPEGGWFDFTTPEDIEGLALTKGGIYVDQKGGNVGSDEYPGFYGHMIDKDGLWDWGEPVGDTQYPVEDRWEMSRKIKEMAYYYGADRIGIAELDSRWVYSRYYDRVTQEEGDLSLEGEPAPESETNISYDYAIAIAVKMDWEGIKESPDWKASAAVAKGYSNVAEVASKLAKYIRGLGYPAVPSGNDTTLSVPISIDAGLGELGRNGLLMTPDYGPNVRLAQVLTDLPLEDDNPIDFGIQKFCSDCDECADACPVDAIPFGEKSEETPGGISNLEGMERWTVDTPSCLGFWVDNDKRCANRIAACPWSDPEFERAEYGADTTHP